MAFHEDVALITPRMKHRTFEQPAPAMKPEDVNFLKLQGTVQVRELSNSLSEVKREIEVLRSHQEHNKLRVQRSIEEQGRRLDNLEREDASRDTSLSLISKSLEEQQKQTNRGAGIALGSSLPPGQLKSLEDRLDLVEALVRATSLMVNETESRLQGKLSTHDLALRQALDDECFMLRQSFEQGKILHFEAVEQETAARQQLELSVQQLQEMADLTQGAQHSLGERLAHLERNANTHSSCDSKEKNDMQFEMLRSFEERLCVLEKEWPAEGMESLKQSLQRLEHGDGLNHKLEAIEKRVLAQGQMSVSRKMEEAVSHLQRIDVGKTAALEDRCGTLEQHMANALAQNTNMAETCTRAIEKEAETRLADFEGQKAMLLKMEETVSQLDCVDFGKMAALEERCGSLERRVADVTTQNAHMVETCTRSRDKEAENRQKVTLRRLEEQVGRHEETFKRIGKMEAQQVQLARGFEEEKRLRAEGLGRERTTSERALLLLKQSLEQLQKDLAKCSTRTDDMQQDRMELRKELAQISQRLEDMSNKVAVKDRLGHGQTEQIESCLQRLNDFASESQQHRNAIEAEVAEVERKLESLQGDMAENEQARATEYTSLAELCAHLERQSEEDRRLRENMPRQEVQKLLSQSVSKMAEESKQHLADLVKKDSATRVDKLFNLSQRLEDVEKRTQMQEIQNRLEKITEDGRKSLEEALGREAALRKELTVLCGRLEELEKSTQVQDIQNRLQRFTEDGRNSLEEALGREAALRKEFSVLFGRLEELEKSTQLQETEDGQKSLEEALRREAAARTELGVLFGQRLEELEKSAQLQEIQNRLERINEDGRNSLEEALGREAAMRKELSVALGQRLEELEKSAQLQEMQNRLERICEDGQKSLEEALGREAATRKELSVAFAQRLEELEKSTQLQEIQNQVERINEDGRKSLEEALEREAATRKELSVAFGQRFDGVEESCKSLCDSLQQERPLPEELQVQLRHQVEVMLNEFLQKMDNRLSLCEKLTSSMPGLLEETSDRTMLSSDVHPAPTQLPASSSALLPRIMPVDMSRLISQLVYFLEELATMGMGAVVYAGTGLWRRLLHTDLQQ